MIHLKNHREIERMRASADLVARTLGEVARYVEPGVTTRRLDQVASRFIRAHGAIPAFKGYRVGQMVFPSTLCTSVNDVVVHGIPNDVPLQEGDVLSVDCGVLLDGFYGDSAYTFAVGEVAESHRALCETTLAALNEGIRQAVAGGYLGDIGHAIQIRCEGRGYGVVRDLVGHGIGRALHEDPQVPNVGRARTGRRLREGLVLCIEPMVNLGTDDVVTGADGWAVRSADGSVSAHYEHMVVVHRGEAEVLTTFGYVEEVVGLLRESPACP